MTTILFGAGASQAFSSLFSTSALTKAIRSNDNWDSVISQVERKVPISRRIIKRARREVLNATRRETSFECILEVFDRVCGYRGDSNPSKNLFNRIVRIIRRNVPIECRNQAERDSYQILPFLAREILARHLINALKQEEEDPSFNRLLQLQHDFIKSSINNDGERSVSLISLNYDTILAESIGHITNRFKMTDLGFISGFPKSVGECNYKQLICAQSSVIYPHGHICFQRLEGYRIKSFDNCSCAEHKRFHDLDYKSFPRTAIGSRGEVLFDFNSFMVTGRTKELSINSEPWGVFYVKSIHEIMRANKCIITIGYSFADAHFNSAIQYALQSNLTGVLFIIDYHSGDYDDNHDLLLRLATISGNSLKVFVDSLGTKTYSQELTNINRNGHGFLFPKIYLYKKGYEAFLTEYRNVMSSFTLAI